MSAATAAAAAAAAVANSSSPATTEDAFRFQEYEGVQFRNAQYRNQQQSQTQQRTINGSPDMNKRKSDQIHTKKAAPRDLPNNIYANTQPLVASEEETESDLNDDDVELRNSTDENPRRRKFHAKSFSMSENQIIAGTNLFQHNRELWEKRSELQSQQSLTTPRILSRNRIAPDLVMDLPFQDDGLVLLSAIEGAPAGEMVRGDASSVDSIDQLTSAERFAAANQCTLKKNERFSGDGCEGTTTAGRITEVSVDEDPVHHHHQDVTDGGEDGSLDNVLRIEEPPSKEEMVRKSPIPTKNTQKFVTKFADLHLTGGCLTASADSAVVVSASSPGGAVTANGSGTAATVTSGSVFSSFKPSVKMKPALLKKPLVIPPGTPEMSRRHED